ncbi:ABC transporter substrate-binding protein [Candidimonas humi]|jgi:iron(III) transport system substrate-binding protein|uniref:ABC transporter substrate-binding protein n=1 Tax=Candidimonas humi TaxID=683355 RepID=A0ABV8P184_9BURK|nr:ABC transporter substrate-binding protein [Candidimonas humi]MBV6306125.1 ABC transporter substrate-binding protein [Candidimonas humi]
MKRTNVVDVADQAGNGSVNRRRFLTTLGGGAMVLGFPFIATSRKALAEGTDNAPLDMNAARKEGPLLLWHGDQEADVVKFNKIFTDKTGIQVNQQRLLPGAAWPKLYAELRAGKADVDVYDTSDLGTMDKMRQLGHLLRYEFEDLDAYDPRAVSNPRGYWATYYINAGPIMYDPRYVKKEEAPKSLVDLLNPLWKNGIGFQNAAAGTSYGMWFVLRNILAKDYWTKLAAQKPRGYSSSTQIMSDIHRGDLKLGGRVSIFQYLKSKRDKQPIEMVFPTEGTPAVNQVTAAFKTTKRPNAAKAYVKFLLSAEGQKIWNEIQGSYSARKDVNIEGLPPLSSIKLLFPTPSELAEYASEKLHSEYLKVWNNMVGL